MADIGRPDRTNPFSKISMAAKEPAARKKKDLGRELNQAAGIREDSQFVDKAKHNQMDKDAFLKLLSHQLQHQDPSSPMDQKKFAADLAQFSQLEQMANMNTKLDKMTSNGPSEMKFYGASFLGKKVITDGTTIEYDGSGRKTSLPFILPNHARNVMIRVYDSRNQMVAQIDRENLAQGPQSVVWDGNFLDGTRAMKDTYRFEVRAWDQGYNEFKGKTQTSGIVTGVDFQDGETVLKVDGTKQVFLRDVRSMSIPDTEKNHQQQNIPALQKNAAQVYNKVDQQGYE